MNLLGRIYCADCGKRLEKMERILNWRSRRYIQREGLAKCHVCIETENGPWSEIGERIRELLWNRDDAEMLRQNIEFFEQLKRILCFGQLADSQSPPDITD